jgi:senataxin
MDDYYRNLREWDFLLEWDSERGGGSGKSGGNGNGGSDKKRKKGSREEIIQSQAQVQEVPNVFASRRQYQKIWAPLCLAETRAQFLSDASGDLPWIKPSHNGNNHNNNGGGDGGNYNNRRNKGNMGPVPVLVKPSVKDVGANVDAMTLVTSPWQDNMGPSFFSGDLVCFAMEESVFVKASKGQLMKGARSNSHGSSGNSSIGGDHDYEGTKAVHGVIGHVEYSRRTTDGLKVRISRQNWVKFCKGEKVEKLFLLKVGGNVTSMREFTALLRVNTSAMLPYLLCKKITKAKDHMEQLSDVISSVAVPMKSSSRSSSSQQKARKDDFFKKLGGKAALGEGFAKYAGNKFNDSQLGAISAAACEYGEGGFTLVKGPPGTGKVNNDCSIDCI